MILNDDDDDNNKDLLKVGKIYLMRKCTRTKRKFDQNPLCMQINKKNFIQVRNLSKKELYRI